MPSKNMIKKGKRRQTVKPAYRAHRDLVRETEERAQGSAEATDAVRVPALPASDRPGEPSPAQLLSATDFELPEIHSEDGVRSFVATPNAQGQRLDAYLARTLSEISRARVQLLIDDGQIRVNGEVAKASLKLAGGERIEIEGEPHPAPLKAEPEEIPLTIVYEDDDLAVIDKPAGMTVHAGAGDAEHNRGTLVNALLFHFGVHLADAGDALRPGLVHRLDKETSGLIVVAKNDAAHRKLAEMFATRSLRKVYLALVHGRMTKQEGTIDLPIGRDPVRRVRMSARRDPGAELTHGARPAVSHWRVLERIGTETEPGPLGVYTLLEVHIETGRTHQIRVHLAAIGHPVVGDTLYGAPGRLQRSIDGGRQPARGRRNSAPANKKVDEAEPTLSRNFLHAAELDLAQPRTGHPLQLRSPLPALLEEFLDVVRGAPANAAKTPGK